MFGGIGFGFTFHQFALERCRVEQPKYLDSARFKVVNENKVENEFYR